MVGVVRALEIEQKGGRGDGAASTAWKYLRLYTSWTPQAGAPDEGNVRIAGEKWSKCLRYRAARNAA